MKPLRIWLLLLLVVLLPLRGALAAGMLCPVGGFGVQAEAGLAGHAHAHDAADAMAQEHQHHAVAAQDHGADHDHDHTGGGSHDHAGSTDNCNVCSAFCSVTALVGADVAVAEPRTVSSAFAHVYAPPPSHVCGGQERPPRTI